MKFLILSLSLLFSLNGAVFASGAGGSGAYEDERRADGARALHGEQGFVHEHYCGPLSLSVPGSGSSAPSSSLDPLNPSRARLAELSNGLYFPGESENPELELANEEYLRTVEAIKAELEKRKKIYGAIVWQNNANQEAYEEAITNLLELEKKRLSQEKEFKALAAVSAAASSDSKPEKQKKSVSWAPKLASEISAPVFSEDSDESDDSASPDGGSSASAAPPIVPSARNSKSPKAPAIRRSADHLISRTSDDFKQLSEQANLRFGNVRDPKVVRLLRGYQAKVKELQKATNALSKNPQPDKSAALMQSEQERVSLWEELEDAVENAKLAEEPQRKKAPVSSGILKNQGKRKMNVQLAKKPSIWRRMGESRVWRYVSGAWAKFRRAAARFFCWPCRRLS